MIPERKRESSVTEVNYQHSKYVNTSETTVKATRPTFPFADVSPFLLTVVVIPVAVVNYYGQAVFPVVVVWITCEEK